MIYAPTDLKVAKLRDVPTGTIVELTHRADDIPRAIKLANHEESASWILPLAGEYAFHVIPWSDDGEITTTLCKPDAIRFKLGPLSSSQNYHVTGVLTLHPEGACIATARQGFPRGPKVDVTSWGFVKSANLDNGCAVYPKWEIGYVDAKHEFVSLFNRA